MSTSEIRWAVYRDKDEPWPGKELVACTQSDWDAWAKSMAEQPNHRHNDRFELVASDLTKKLASQFIQLAKES